MKKTVSIIVIILSIIFALTGCNQQRLVFSSTIESTQVDINSEVNGKILKINFQEGQNVKKGDTLVFLDSSSAELQLKQAEAGVLSAKAKLAETKKGSRIEQINQAQAAVNAAKAKLDELRSGSRKEQINQARSVVEQAKTAVSFAEKTYNYRLDNLEKARELLEYGGTSQQNVNDLENLTESALTQFNTAKEQLKSAQSQLDLLVSGPTSEAIKAAEAAYQQTKAQLDLVKNGSTKETITISEAGVKQAEDAAMLAKLQLEKFNVKSPITGRIQPSYVDIGEVVFPGTNIASILDENDLWLKFYIPERYKHKIGVGSSLIIKTKAFPKEKIMGKITYVSSKAEFTPKNIETVEAKENTVFEVKVKIMDHLNILRPGMTAEVEI
ncbi:MAG: HlyD family secretion protein [Ignavibacteriales bacterium]